MEVDIVLLINFIFSPIYLSNPVVTSHSITAQIPFGGAWVRPKADMRTTIKMDGNRQNPGLNAGR